VSGGHDGPHEVNLGTELVLERKPEDDRTTLLSNRAVGIALAPAVDESYWAYRVKLNDRQAVLAFPKFGTIGIGFAVEDDWNTNLPYTCETIDIVSHIWHNVDSGKPAGDEFGEVEGDDITVAQVYAAVGAIQDAIALDHPDAEPPRSHPSVMAVTVRGITAGG
jgi:hypothetical protein